MDIKMSKEHKQYVMVLQNGLDSIYRTARKAREKGLDPALCPEPEIASDLAELVEGLVGPPGVAQSIRDLSKKLSREELAFKVAEEIVYGKFGHMDARKAADQAIRTALAILTEGITAAPLQGVAQVAIKSNADRTRYLAIYFAGPIRSAGGTEQALTLVIGDFVRRLLGLERYKPTEEEMGRFVEEVRLFERSVARFQYRVSDEELRRALEYIPVEATGTETNPIEVSSFRNLRRVETNRIRGGALRVVNDGVVGRSAKVWTIVEKLGIEGWDWLRRIREIEEKKTTGFMEDVIAGRPIFSFPSRQGGFRLRYGRARNTGLAAVGVHPATMMVLQRFLAAGTQLRIEGPGKAGVVLPVDTLEPPIVRLKDGSVIRVTLQDFEQIKDVIDRIIFLGDILISFGDFLYNNKPLLPSGFTEEWWCEELRAVVKRNFHGSIEEAATAAKVPASRLEIILHNPFENKPTAEEAISLASSFQISLHPFFTYFWSNISSDEFQALRRWLLRCEVQVGDEVVHEIKGLLDKSIKEMLERLCVPHRIVEGSVKIEGDEAHAFAFCLGLHVPKARIMCSKSVFENIHELSGVVVREKAPTFLGARMGRPEKAKRREMKPLVHVLFPVGLAGGSRRNLVDAVSRVAVEVDLVRRRCPDCREKTSRTKCPKCGAETVVERFCPRCGRTLKERFCPVCKVPTKNYERQSMNFRTLMDDACQKLSLPLPTLVKGVKGLSNETKTAEIIEKGILRAKYDLSVFKDGTIRFDITNVPLSLDHDERVCLLTENGYLQFVKIGSFIDKLMKRIKCISDALDYEIFKSDSLQFKVLAFNPITLNVEPKEVTAFIRHRTNCPLYRVRTSTGREIVVTKYHSLFTFDTETGKIVPVRTDELLPGSFIVTPRRISYEKDTEYINIFSMCIKDPEKIWVKAPREVLKNMIQQLGGVSHVARVLSVKRPTMSSWITKGNIPLKIFMLLANKLGISVDSKYLGKNRIFLRWVNSRGLEIPAIIPVDNPLLTIMGYYTSEGWCDKKLKKGRGRRVWFRNLHKEILNDLMDCFRQVFYVEPKISRREIGKLYVNSNLLAEIITRFLRMGSDSSEKRIPGFILSLPRPRLAYFLRAYFSGDGYVDKAGSNCIGCSTVSKELANDLLYSLLRYGIVARVEKRIRPPDGICKNSRIQPIYIIQFGGRENVRKFRSHIGFVQKENMRAIKSYLKNTPACPWRTDIMPLKRFLRASLGKNDFLNIRLSRGETITRVSVDKIANAISNISGLEELNSTLTALANCDLFFDRVETIEEVSPTSKYVYDLEVQPKGEKIENFLSGFGGIFAHNTHFKPVETSVSVERLQQLGYHYDYDGNPLSGPDQICELKVQDVVIPFKCAEYFVRVASFLDELLEKVYDIPPYYNVKSVSDLVGHLVIGLAPHTSVGILGRIIGFTDLSVCYAHPLWHSAKRRDCDGDEDTLMLALDTILNFSKAYLPAQIGGIMDAPLFVIPVVNPQEIQRQAHEMDVARAYPLVFYEKTMQKLAPREVSEIIDTIGHRLNTEAQFEGFNYTTPVSNINLGNRESLYKRLKRMIDKLHSQLSLAEKIEAVDAELVAQKVLTTHFIRDIVGNLRAFTTQNFRCKACNKRFRRLPLRGKCPECGGTISLTVYRGGIEKYLEAAHQLIRKYGLPNYYAQRLRLVEEEIDSLFEGKKPKQVTLGEFIA